MKTWKRWAVAIGATVAFATRPQPSTPVESCWSTNDRSTGLTWWYRDAHVAKLELGWGYEGADVCAMGNNRGRTLVSWGWADPYGGRPELRAAVVERGRVIAAREIASGGWGVQPIAVVPMRDGGWRIRYLEDEGGAERSVRVDQNGR